MGNADANAARELGNRLYKQGDLAGAIDAYSAGISASARTGDAAPDARLLTNRAACHLTLGNLAQAAADCRAALAIDPMNARAWSRLARSLPDDDGDGDSGLEAAAAVCCAVATAPTPDAETLAAYVRLQRRHGEWMPRDRRAVVLVSSVSEMAASPPRGRVHVLRPGVYETNFGPSFAGGAGYIGLGDVVLRSAFSHAVLALGGASFVAGVRLEGGGTFAAACVVESARLILHRCSVKDYQEGGVVIDGGRATISRCCFEKLARQAVEVRRGGRLDANGLTISECRQGIVAYGGARTVNVSESKISKCKAEGILAQGTFENASTAMQLSVGLGQGGLTQPTADAVAWGLSRRLDLSMTLKGVTISNCAQFGLSIDYGATVAIHKCHFESNDPVSVFIKGGSNCTISASSFIFTGKPAKWGLEKIQQRGVHVAVNYAGNVDVIGSAFAGPEHIEGIHEAREHLGRHRAAAMGMWSKPIRAERNLHYPPATTLPTLDYLEQRVPVSDQSRHKQPRDTRKPTPDSELRRPSRTSQNPPWSPTASEYYAIGNTPGFNVAAAGYPGGGGDMRVLFGACGDVRNVLATAGKFQGSVLQGGKCEFVLNDGNVSMLARNAVLLHMAWSSAPDEAVVAVWGSHGLTESEFVGLKSSLERLANEPWPSWLSARTSLNEPNEPAHAAEQSMREVFRSWLESKFTLTEMLRLRDAVVKPAEKRVVELSFDAVRGAAPKSRAEISTYISRGSLGADRKNLIHANSTLLLAPEMQYTVYATSSIFRAVSIPREAVGATAFQKLVSTLTEQFAAFRAGADGGRLTVVLVRGDIIKILTESPGEKGETAVFDFIDCSNVADYTSVPLLVQSAAPLLRRSQHARLSLETIRLYRIIGDKKQPSRQLVEKWLGGVSLPLFEYLCGLSLVDAQPLEAVGSPTLRMTWGSLSDSGPKLNPSPGFIVLGLLKAYKTATATEAPGSEVEGLLLSALLRSSSNPLFNWEMELHAAVQHPSSTRPRLVRLTYEAKPDISLLLHRGQHLAVALSKRPLLHELAGPGAAAAAKGELQLLASFAWDPELAVAAFALPESTLGAHGSWVATLCVWTEGGIVPVGQPAALGKLPAAPFAASAWRRLDESGCAALGSVAAVERVVAKDRPKEWWGEVAGGCDPSEVFVDVCAPGPFPKPEEATVDVSVKECALVASVKSKAKKSSRVTASGGESQGFSIELPHGQQHKLVEVLVSTSTHELACTEQWS
ncbi:hypothetical protein DFJ73DRAFT_775797 [Zopfochytrium polystomum]|nr:hypothetical protein DFJ73DRAFT_775797 [Zopfochytrium polystomum]